MTMSAPIEMPFHYKTTSIAAVTCELSCLNVLYSLLLSFCQLTAQCFKSHHSKPKRYLIYFCCIIQLCLTVTLN